MENTPKAQVIERLREAQNILVTVSNNPSVDQLSAAIGFTLMMNKLNKRTTAVFSGEVPSTLEFLKPEETFEQNTDSLRDFIISLDKSKADKLRYKVEEDVVRIFITPYKTRLSNDDLEYSQGDFNVDVVVALGVDQREHIDAAIMAHGRILHDATVIGIMAGETPIDVGGINWQDASASSLCEMLVGIGESFQKGLLDPQMATSYLTGIVAETERFSNEKTSPKVMTMSAQLMAAGANQQLIATELVEPVEQVDDEYVFDELPTVQDETEENPLPYLPPPPAVAPPNNNEGVISLHDDPVVEEAPEPEEEPQMPVLSEPAPAYEEPSDEQSLIDKINIDKQGTLHSADEVSRAAEAAAEALQVESRDANVNRGKVVQPLTEAEMAAESTTESKYVTDPPMLGGTLTASGVDEATQVASEQSVDPLSAIPQSSFPEANIATPATFGQQVSGVPLPPEPQQGMPPEMVSPDAARQAVQDATNGSFDPARPGALVATGAEYVPLNSEPMSQTGMQPEDDRAEQDEPPEVPPPLPMPGPNGTMPLPN